MSPPSPEGGGEEEDVVEEEVDQDVSVVTMDTLNRNCLHHMHSKLYLFVLCFALYTFYFTLLSLMSIHKLFAPTFYVIINYSTANFYVNLLNYCYHFSNCSTMAVILSSVKALINSSFVALSPFVSSHLSII